MSTSKPLDGSCLCGEVTFTVGDDFSAFYQCHCKQCQQQTGSAFASNIFTTPNNIKWTRGEDSIVRYEHATRSFSKAFCQVCGSSLPFVTKSKQYLIVPAGALLTRADIPLTAEIFCGEKAWWQEGVGQAKKHEGFPE